MVHYVERKKKTDKTKVKEEGDRSMGFGPKRNKKRKKKGKKRRRKKKKKKREEKEKGESGKRGEVTLNFYFLFFV